VFCWIVIIADGNEKLFGDTWTLGIYVLWAPLSQDESAAGSRRLRSSERWFNLIYGGGEGALWVKLKHRESVSVCETWLETSPLLTDLLKLRRAQTTLRAGRQGFQLHNRPAQYKLKLLPLISVSFQIIPSATIGRDPFCPGNSASPFSSSFHRWSIPSFHNNAFHHSQSIGHSVSFTIPNRWLPLMAKGPNAALHNRTLLRCARTHTA